MKAGNNMIFTFPYAGGSSLSFNHWNKFLTDYDLINLDYPGHGKRSGLPLEADFDALTEDMVHQVLSYKPVSGKYVFYGHSMGALAAYYTALSLIRSHNTVPAALILSAAPAPEFVKPAEFDFASDEDLIRYLSDSNRIPKVLLRSKTFLSSLMPVIINDFSIIAHFSAKNLEIIDVPIIALTGDEDDSLPLSLLSQWKKLTTSKFRALSIPGDHFFLEKSAEKICHIITSTLEETM